MVSKKMSELFKKNINKKVLLYSVFLVIGVVSAVLTVQAFSTPLQVEEKIQENNIVQKTDFKMQANVRPSILYPEGGTIATEGAILTEITDTIHVQVDTTVQGDKPVKVTGSKGAILQLISEGLWTREYVLEEENPFILEGKQNMVLNAEYTINLPQLASYIEEVEKETKTGGDYYFKIRPLLAGTITYGEKEVSIDSSPELLLQYRGKKIQLAKDAKTEYLQETPIMHTEVTPRYFALFGKQYSLISARYVFSILTIVSLLFLFFNLVRNLRLKQAAIPEAQRIDKKYKSRIIVLEKGIDFRDKSHIHLQAFAPLLKVADEREQPIFKWSMNDLQAMYCVADGDNFYSYIVTDIPNKKPKADFSTANWGSDPSHAK